MMKKSIWFIVLSVFICGIKAQEKQNALLIILDDINDYIGVMKGHPQAITPHIDQLASEGLFFSNAHSSAPICAPSRASFLSGLYPSTTSNFAFSHISDNQVLTNSKFIMEYAAENGFETYSTGKVFHRSADDPSKIMGQKQDQGPTAWDGVNAISHPSVPLPFRNVGVLNGSFAPLSDVPEGGWRNNYDASTAFRYESTTDRDKMCDELSADYVCEWIDKHEDLKEAGKDKPFFIAYGGMKPHTPHVVPQHFFDKFPLDKVVIPEILKNDLKDTYYKNLSMSGFNDYDSLLVSYNTQEEGVRRYVQSKLACISFADSLVGVINSKLKSSSFATNTVVILCGDNGFHMGEKFRLAKNTLWEESTRIPFILKAPGYELAKGKEVLHPVGLIDIYPTLKELCQMSGDTKKTAQGADLDGYSLKPFLENPETNTWEGPTVALEAVVNPSSKEVGLQNYAVRSEKYRYILYSSGDEELYDHSKDSKEWKNLIFDPNYAEIAESLREELKALVPEVSFEKKRTIPYLYYDDFESYSEGDNLLSMGYKQKTNEETTTILRIEDGNQFAQNTAVDGSSISMRKNLKNLVPGKVYFFEATTRTSSSVTAGSWEALAPNYISGHACNEWETFQVPLIPDIESWGKGLSMNLFIGSAQNTQLDVDNFSFYAADITIEDPKTGDAGQLLVDASYQFSASVIPFKQAYTWSVEEGSGSISVDENGIVKALTPGSALLIATMDKYPTVNCTTEVFIWDEAFNPSISITAPEYGLLVNEPHQFEAIISPTLEIPLLWSIDDASKAIINQTAGFILPQSPGIVTVTAKLYNNESVFDTKRIIIGDETSVRNNKKSIYTIYPNPSGGLFYIKGEQGIIEGKLYNCDGGLIKLIQGNEFNLQDYAKGIYFLVLNNNETHKLIIGR